MFYQNKSHEMNVCIAPFPLPPLFKPPRVRWGSKQEQTLPRLFLFLKGERKIGYISTVQYQVGGEWRK